MLLYIEVLLNKRQLYTLRVAKLQLKQRCNTHKSVKEVERNSE